MNHADLMHTVTDFFRFNNSSVQRIVPWLQIVTGSILIALAYFIGNLQFDLIRNGIRTTGKIVRFEYLTYSMSSAHGFRSSSAFHPVVELKVDGQRVEFRDRIGSVSGAGMNATVPVLFNPKLPTMAMIDRPFWNWLPWAPTLAVGAILLLIGLRGVFRREASHPQACDVC